MKLDTFTSYVFTQAELEMYMSCAYPDDAQEHQIW
jgi:hypothetical protein